MEFIEYYRIIRRRIWLALLMAGLAAAVVVAARLVPKETVYTAAGHVLVHDLAKRQYLLQGNELIIGLPQNEDEFWANLSPFVGSRFVLEAAAADIGISSAEATEQLEPASAQRLGESNVAMIIAGATGVPPSLTTGEASNASDVAVRYCNAIMTRLDELWKARQNARIDHLRDVLNERLPGIETEINQVQQEADKLTAAYDGVPPTGVEERLTEELNTIEQQVTAAEISRGAATARAEVLAGEQGRARTTTAPMITAAENPRIAALRQTILEKQIQLDEELSRRTEEHEAVKMLEAEIKRLQERLAELEKSEEQGPLAAASPTLQEAAVAAEIEAAALNRRIDLLQQRAGQIRDRLPSVREDARLYEQISKKLEDLKLQRDAILGYLDRLDFEQQQLENATLMEVIGAAEPQRVPRGLGRFLLELGAALIIGGGVGVLFVFLLHYIDFSFQDEQEAELVLDVPVLAGIPRSDVVLEEPVAATTEGLLESDDDVL